MSTKTRARYSSWSQRVITALFATMALFTVVGAEGCVTTNFTRPVRSFQQSYTTAAPVLSTFYNELNDLEREHYVHTLAYDPSRELLYNEAGGRPTPLLGRPFSVESIAARADAIRLLGVYTTRLADLAGSDAPQRIATASGQLGSNLNDLQQTFRQLNGDAAAPNYVGPIGTLIGLVGREVSEARRNDALRESITQGAPAVRSILDLLAQDITEISQVQTANLRDMIDDRRTAYNNHRNQPNVTAAQRQAELAEIVVIVRRYEALRTANLGGVISAMRDAHEGLVRYAQQSSHSPENLEALNSVMETFAARVEEVVNAVKAIRGAREEH